MSLYGLLNQIVTIYNRSSYDAYGREVVGDGVQVRARVQQVTKSRLLANGQQITIDAVAYLDGNASISANDRVDFGGTRYKVFGKSTGINDAGNTHHTKLELIKWTHN